MIRDTARPNGEAVAAILSAAIGSFLVGVFTVLAEVSPGAKEAMVLQPGVGPLSGKTTFAVIGWVIAWALLHMSWRGKTVDMGRWMLVTWVLITLAFILTFPPVFLLFEAE